MTEKLRTLLRALAAYPGAKYPLIIDHDGDLYRDAIAAGGEIRRDYHPAEDDKPATVIDSAELSIDGKRWGRSLTVALPSRTASKTEMRDYEQAQQAMAVLGKDIAEA